MTRNPVSQAGAEDEAGGEAEAKEKAKEKAEAKPLRGEVLSSDLQHPQQGQVVRSRSRQSRRKRRIRR